MEIRKSTAEDIPGIITLVHVCFGDVPLDFTIGADDGRYMLMVDGKKIVAMSGIVYDPTLKAAELDYTCTDPDYVRNGYMTELLRTMLEDMPQLVYASAWKPYGRNSAPICDILIKLSFIPVMFEYKRFAYGVNCHTRCPNHCVEGCECHCDLYRKVGAIV